MKLHNNSKILVVEDNDSTRMAIVGMLRALGYTTIVEATNGREALKIIDENKEAFELVLSDLKMPHVTGVQLLRDFRMLFPKIPFIIASAYHDIENVVVAKEAGVTCFIAKPFTRAALAAKLDLVNRRMLYDNTICTNVDKLIEQIGHIE